MWALCPILSYSTFLVILLISLSMSVFEELILSESTYISTPFIAKCLTRPDFSVLFTVFSPLTFPSLLYGLYLQRKPPLFLSPSSHHFPSPAG